ncbi:Magnesium-chelatase subunit chlI, chloroplastic [Gossypium arboreum]|uniref:magnesium chelatase n=1 Tax=Gossypium arboreum TaxID=29729 RepID=A0A0B0N647_GOSAR|nr:Magnesium-chelatase subunit chlI, chloroplastic [Gossypium arboreum]
MASVLGTSTAILASRSLVSPSLKPAFPSISINPGQGYGRKLYGGIGIQGRKGRPQFHIAVTNVATEINSVEQAQKVAAKESQRPVFPFAAIVGQDEMKLCLLLNVIDPKIGGVMIMGDRGTGKSTTVRSLVDLLPEIRVVFVGTVRDAELRVKIVEERARFDKNPKEFRDSYKAEQEKLQQQIASARSSLSSVQIDQDLKVKISKVCAELNVDGLRGDIVTNRAAKALAALKGRDKVIAEDIATVIPNCLRHRLRKDPLESIDSGLLVIEKFYEVFG